ncbi:hypothetical protein JB92DRAFT_3097495 [Gautieria morchelliformis]|nr:hypothetical protein JB92DRAFT_3097495 [Gautieria morchelliformis]
MPILAQPSLGVCATSAVAGCLGREYGNAPRPTFDRRWGGVEFTDGGLASARGGIGRGHGLEWTFAPKLDEPCWELDSVSPCEASHVHAHPRHLRLRPDPPYNPTRTYTKQSQDIFNFSSTFASSLRLDVITSPLNLKVCISKIKVNPYSHEGHFDSNRQANCHASILRRLSSTPPGTPIASSYGRKYLANKQEALLSCRYGLRIDRDLGFPERAIDATSDTPKTLVYLTDIWGGVYILNSEPYLELHVCMAWHGGKVVGGLTHIASFLEYWILSDIDQWWQGRVLTQIVAKLRDTNVYPITHLYIHGLQSRVQTLGEASGKGPLTRKVERPDHLERKKGSEVRDRQRSHTTAKGVKAWRRFWVRRR